MAPSKPKVETENKVSKRKVKAEDKEVVKKIFRLPEKFTLHHHESFTQERPDVLLSEDNQEYIVNPRIANRQSRTIKRLARTPRAGVRYVELYGISARTVGAFADWTFGKSLQLKDDTLSDAIELYVNAGKLGAFLFQELIIWKLCEAGRKSARLEIRPEHIEVCYRNTERGDACRSLITNIVAYRQRSGQKMAFRSSTQTQRGSKEDQEREGFRQLPGEFPYDLMKALSKPESKNPCLEPEKYMAADIDDDDDDDTTYVAIDDAVEDAATLFYS